MSEQVECKGKTSVEKLNYQQFNDFISSRFIGENIVQLLYTGIVAAFKAGTVPAFLLQGPAGTGKTMITELVAKYFDAEYFFIQTTLNASEDDLLYRYTPSEETKSGVRIIYGPLPEALIKSKEKMTVLVIDEFDKTRPSADALLLDYLQNARVSMRIDEKENVIVGNKSNLIVFLTSNNYRDFSEPLMRRVITINFTLMSPERVQKYLAGYFDDLKVIKVLTAVYIAGLNTKLSKPVTIQELVQLGHAMKISPNTPFEELLLAFVIKNKEDLVEFKKSIEKIDLSQFRQNITDNGITEVITNKINTAESESKKESEEQPQQVTVSQLLSAINVQRPVIEPVKLKTISPEVKYETTLSIPDDDFSSYTNVIMKLEPKPSDDPTVFGKFKAVLDDVTKKMNITSEKPLNLIEVSSLIKNTSQMRAYIEDYLVDNVEKEIFRSFMGSSKLNLKIKYYTKNTVIIATTDNKIIIRLDKIKQHSYFNLFTLKMYIDIDKTTNEPVSEILSELIEYMVIRYLTWASMNLSDLEYLKIILDKDSKQPYILIDIDYKERFMHIFDVIDVFRELYPYEIKIKQNSYYKNTERGTVYTFKVEKELYKITINVPDVLNIKTFNELIKFLHNAEVQGIHYNGKTEVIRKAKKLGGKEY